MIKTAVQIISDWEGRKLVMPSLTEDAMLDAPSAIDPAMFPMPSEAAPKTDDTPSVMVVFGAESIGDDPLRNVSAEPGPVELAQTMKSLIACNGENRSVAPSLRRDIPVPAADSFIALLFLGNR